MCDTFVVLPSKSESGALLFAKNSDRERNEAQWLQFIERGQHAPGSPLRTTYITIPQAESTYAVLLSRPYWMWGAEMGANEHGVVIGNEAMHATIPAQREQALLGMDLVRLGLERAQSAEEAVETIICLLEQYGQGGNCGQYSNFFYQNGFIVADSKAAFVLETIGSWWAVEEVSDYKALSNAYSINDGYKDVSSSLVDHAKSMGWLTEEGRLNLADTFTDLVRDSVTFGRGRCARGTELLNNHQGGLSAQSLKAILRDHGPESDGNHQWRPADTVGRTICMHAAEGPRRGQTTGSMVSELYAEGRSLHWMTGTAAPCTSVFKPVVLSTGLPQQGPKPNQRFDARALWWKHELLHRRCLEDYAEFIPWFAERRDNLEMTFRERMNDAMRSLEDGDPALQSEVEECWRQAADLESEWLAKLRSVRTVEGRNTPFHRSWRRLNQVARIPQPC